MTPQQKAQQWVDGNVLIIDTETTGLDDNAEACEIAVLNANGEVLFDRVVRPTVPIGRKAMRVHGIRNMDIKSVPSLAEYTGELSALLTGKRIIAYNSGFDERILRQSYAAIGVTFPDGVTFECAMLAYAEWYGERNERTGGWRWQKLERAAVQCGHASADPVHRALADCRSTLAVIKAMAASDGKTEKRMRAQLDKQAKAPDSLTGEEKLGCLLVTGLFALLGWGIYWLFF